MNALYLQTICVSHGKGTWRQLQETVPVAANYIPGSGTTGSVGP